MELLILLLLFPNDLASHLSCNGRNPHGAKRSANGGGPSLEVERARGLEVTGSSFCVLLLLEHSLYGRQKRGFVVIKHFFVFLSINFELISYIL